MTTHKGDFDVCRTTFGRSFGFGRTVTITSASTLTLNSFSTGYQIFDGAVSGQIVNLGDTTTYFKDGYSYIFLNDSDNSIILENSGGLDLFTLEPNSGVIAILESSTTADGFWRFLSIGNGDGNVAAGQIISHNYIGNGAVKNQWLCQEDQNIISNQSPDIFKYDAKLVAVDYTNNNPNTDPIVLIAIRNAGAADLNQIDRSYKWTLTNVRAATKTNSSLGFTINAGDMMAVYIEDGGGDPFDCVITMDFITLSAPDQSITNNASGDFNSNDFPAINTIPEILE
jgi:hypothetical protein